MQRYAFVVNNLLDEYQQTLWAGLQRAADDMNVQLIAVPGRDFNSTDLEDKAYTYLFDFLRSSIWDGMIISASFNINNTSEQISSFFKQFNLPYVTMGYKLDNSPCVLVDNRTGLYKLISHFIEKHQIRDIGFIRGPHNNEEAEIRYGVFKKALEDHGIQENPQWIKEGEFDVASGRDCAKEIWKSSKKPKALLGANDQMLIGAMEYLLDQHVNIPGELALGGFDNIDECEYLPVPLSTVSQPIEEQAYNALILLHRYATTGEKPQDLSLDTQPVFRESCGCFSSSVLNAGVVVLDPSITAKNKEDMETHHFIGEILLHQLKIDPQICRAYRELPPLLILLDDYCQIQSEENLYAYLRKLSGLLIQEEDKHSLVQWNMVLTATCLAYNFRFPYFRESMESIIQRSYVLVGEKISQHLSHNSLQLTQRFTVLQNSLRRIMEAYDMDEIVQQILEELENIGFGSFYLSLFQNDLLVTRESEIKLPEISELKIAYKNGKVLSNREESFVSVNLLPEHILKEEENCSLLTQMLLFDERLVGFILCDTRGNNGRQYEALRSQISSSIRSGYLMEEMQRSEKMALMRSEKIQENLLPMLNAIDSVVTIIAEKIERMEQAAEEFSENQSTFKQTSDSVENIADSAKYMLVLIKEIDDISEQINILSINASIESARAGVHGRGFAVISGEVRKLADSTAQTTTQTKTTLQQVMQNIKVSRESSTKSFTTYSTIQEDMSQLAQSLTSIENKMKELKDFSRDIMTLIKS
ncbi:MAG: substrate-binding domain-containing protein [Spirochaetaceae bacterium]|jgi:DNA-binding LacI/PurR family transcriptional regulator|nr:substrate-binding domain-containing protein [Spirochaetaceae bacterium]